MRFRSAKVVEVVEKNPAISNLTVELEGREFAAVNFNDLTGSSAPGDEVIVNTSAIDLELGSGGVHYVLWNLKRRDFVTENLGHIIKMRYTPLQVPILSVEEQESPHHERMSNTELFGMPCIIGSLHSQLAPVVLTIKAVAPKVKIAYVMTDGGALPLALSDTVNRLKMSGLLDSSITVGQAFGGDLEAINIYSGLIASKYVAKADIAVTMMGPGIVGTNTPLGFSGIEQGQIINAVHSLGGHPIAIPRISFKDKRERHFGLSHHFVTSLTKAALAKSSIILSDMPKAEMDLVKKRLDSSGLSAKHAVEVVLNEITLRAIEESGIKLTTMGRSPDEDPVFFKTAGSCGLYALRLLGVEF